MELKDLQTQMQTTFESLKEMGQRQDTEIKQFGTATQETKDAIGKINSTMDEIKTKIADIETKANRAGFNHNEPPKEEKEKKSAFFKFMREGIAGLNREEKALVQDQTGEIIVPEQLDQEIYRELPGLTVMRGLASVRPTTSNRVRRRSMNEVTTGWGKIETNAAKSLGDFESTLVPAEDWLYVENAYGLTKVGEDELEDTDVNLQQYIRESFAQAFAEMEDTAFIKGTGHGDEQPEGILNGNIVGRFNSGGVGTFEADDLIKLAYQLPAQYRRNGSYIVNSQVELLMRLMKDENGQYLWQPSLQQGKPATFNGKPVYNQEDVDGEIAAGNEVAVFGDYKQGYRILDRNGGAITRINELYIEDGLIGFKYRRRVGGGVVRPKALKVLKIGE